MTGNSTITPQILGVSTVAGVAATVLPKTGASVWLTPILAIALGLAAAVLISRIVKVFATRK